jgi:DNA-binding NarL/FixJ family response regulator
MIRVLIVDDQTLVRDGFRMILDAQEDIEVVGEAGDGLDAIQKARELRPEVVLMDVRMPGRDGVQATRELLLELPGTHVLILTTFDLNEYVYEAMKAGASGFLLKDAPRSQLVEAVRTVARGDALLAPAITRRMIEQFVRRPPASVRALPAELDELTPRELEVLKLVAGGRSNREIARELFVSDATVKTHLAHALRKLDLRDRVQAVVFAYESGLIEPGAEESSSGGGEHSSPG